MLTDKTFWVNTLEDALRAAAGALVGLFGVNTVHGGFTAEASHYALAALGAAATTILTAIVSTKRGDPSSARLNKTGEG